MLSAKLYEDRLIFIETEELEYAKTQVLAEIMAPFDIDRITFLTPTTPETKNFELAARNIKNINVVKPQQFNVPDLLNSDYIFVTKQGLIELEDVLESRRDNLFRNKKVPNAASLERNRLKRMDPFEEEFIKPILDAAEIEGHSDELPLELQSETLKNYIDDLRKLQESAIEKKVAADKAAEEA